MIVERTENPQWLSNAYLVADEESGKGVLIDGNDELGPLLERVERDGIEITHVLVTHPHLDHVAGLAEARQRLGNPPLVAHPAAAAELDEEVAQTLDDGEKLTTNGLEIEAIFTPGHAAGHLAYLVNGTDVFTADVLFKGTVGGTMAPGASGFADLKSSVMERLMTLPPRDARPPRPPRADDDRRGVGGQPVRAGLARAGRGRRRELHGVGARGDAEALGARLRRRQQGLDRLRRQRRGGDRRRLPGRARLVPPNSTRAPPERGLVTARERSSD